jgi:hypothetical protein
VIRKIYLYNKTSLNDRNIYGHHLDVMEMYGTYERAYIQLVCARVIEHKMRLMLRITIISFKYRISN